MTTTLHRAAATALAALICGCAGSDEPLPPSLAPFYATGREATLASFALPQSPRVLGVDTRRPNDRSILQRVTLENATTLANENAIELALDLRLDGLSDRLGIEPRESVVRPRARSDLREFLLDEFPGLHMTIAEAAPSNRYGPYAYATGRGPVGETCLYAWQVVDPSMGGLPRGYYRLGLSFRFCDPVRSADELQALFLAITVAGAR